jgi:hypothetical protein
MSSMLHQIADIPQWGRVLSPCHFLEELPALDTIPGILRARLQRHMQVRIPWTLEEHGTPAPATECQPVQHLKAQLAGATAIQAHMLRTILGTGVTNSGGSHFGIAVTNRGGRRGCVRRPKRSGNVGSSRDKTPASVEAQSGEASAPSWEASKICW